MSASPTHAESGLMRRVVRRETHSSRAIVSTVAAVVVSLLAIYALLESILRALGQPAWLIDPQSALDRLAGLPGGVAPALLGAIGLVLVLMGLVFFLNAVLPGRRARHTLPGGRVSVVVDDEVIASALARRARLAAGVTQEQVMVVVSQRTVVVNVRPTSGVPLGREAIARAVEDELEQMAPEPMPAVTVNLATSGVIGV